MLELLIWALPEFGDQKTRAIQVVLQVIWVIKSSIESNLIGIHSS